MQRDEVVGLIAQERQRQDDQWGGAEHDRYHSRDEWVAILADRLRKLDRAMREPAAPDFNRRLIQVAAVVIAALETS